MTGIHVPILSKIPVIKLLMALAISLTLASCTEKFDYTSYTSENLLVVDGGITNKKDIQYIRLSYSTLYGTSPFSPVTNAAIDLFENDVKIGSFNEISQGIYSIDGTIVNAQPGKYYSIEMKLSNGKIYRSTPEMMPLPVKPDSAYFELKNTDVTNDDGALIKKYYINVYVDTPVRVQGHTAFLRWRVAEAFSFTEIYTGPFSHPKTCYANSDITYQGIQIFGNMEVSGGTLKRQLVLKREPSPDLDFIERHYFNISQYTITAASYEYWNKLKIVANPTGSFIDIPPAAVLGNLHNINDNSEPVLGYFEVASEEIIRVFSYPDMMMPYWVHQPCSYYPWPDYCYNCLLIPNSSYDRPNYW